MKIRMKTLMAGPDGVVQPGQLVDVPAARGEYLVANGYAEKLEVPAKASVNDETASVEGAPEAATERRGRRQGKRGE